jgi:hypothetical protein
MSRSRTTVTASETIHVDRPPDAVFDYTQDYGHRTEWDPSIAAAEIVSEEPRRVRVRVPGVGTYVIEYRLFRRGDRTSAAFIDVDSSWMSGGGGSWAYRTRDGGTEWTQTNTIELGLGWLGRLLAPFVRRQLRSSMRTGMARAKTTLESGG